MQFKTLTTDLQRWLKLDWDGAVVHYDEIALKGGNRGLFISTLQRNLENILMPFQTPVQRFWDRFVLRPPKKFFFDAINSASKVFGVAYIAPVRFLGMEVEVLANEAIQTYRLLDGDKASFAVRVRRLDKKFPLTSIELETAIGQKVKDQLKVPVNLTAPDILFSFRIYEDHAYLVGPKLEGFGGLPVGVTGKVLTLFSGGIDSPVASWLIMRRGCRTDFVHFHAFRSADEVMGTKIPDMIERIINPQGIRSKLFLVPYHAFQLALINRKIEPKLDLILFRRFMVKVAQMLSKRHGHQAIVTGDNLGQVASQTIESLTALDDVTTIPIFRPLLTYDKAEIISISQQIGTYELSVQPYKDCCSIISQHPKTRPKLKEVQASEANLRLEQAALTALAEMEVWEIGSGKHRANTT